MGFEHVWVWDEGFRCFPRVFVGFWVRLVMSVLVYQIIMTLDQGVIQ